MDKCWASKFSKCSNKISKEHLISNGIFEQKDIYVEGFPWCIDGFKKISVASLTAKILCTRHNSELSPIDIEGINAVRIFEELLIPELRTVKTPPINKSIDGYLFERWLLKVALNVSFKSGFHIGVGMGESEVGKPSPYLLAVIFGELNLSHSMGLYTLENSTPIFCKKSEISIAPIHKNRVIGGFLFNIRGVNFFLSLFPGSPVPSLRSLGLDENFGLHPELLNSEPKYRLSTLDVKELNREVMKVNFSW
ncbi:hypothetical protein [Neptunomonas sp.]|uniref:hypothetical protein n=1 Tax=Neptunomonas TaxID=75687 RepID=UPI003515996F